ncbi:MAG: hypothetical protein RSE16_02110 [Sphingobium sp.]|nr:MAG: hypothetical protein RSE16_02110 [Sphingobium sp.]
MFKMICLSLLLVFLNFQCLHKSYVCGENFSFLSQGNIKINKNTKTPEDFSIYMVSYKRKNFSIYEGDNPNIDDHFLEIFKLKFPNITDKYIVYSYKNDLILKLSRSKYPRYIHFMSVLNDKDAYNYIAKSFFLGNRCN